jgi:hypothetical protein
MNITEENKATQ